MNAISVITLTSCYLGLLFLVARWGKGLGRLLIEKYSSYFYGLGLGVYATAWTFYGSIGRAATNGLDFLAIYIGPVLFLPVWWFVMKKVVRISKAQHLNSLSDFITARYGKSWSLGLVVTLLVVMAITPYLALQIKAISSSANVLLSDARTSYIDLDIVATGLLLLFTLIYGVHFSFDANQRNGLIATIGFESIVKVLAAFLGGWVIIQGDFEGGSQVFERAEAAGMSELFVIQNPNDWWLMMLVSGFAFFLLPRQFQMAVVSNRSERDLRKALWIVPLFLLLMNFWVVPIALAGNLSLGSDTNPDYHFLSLALAQGYQFLPGIIFLGGLAACTSMIIVSASALSAMVSSNILLPATLKRDGTPRFDLNPIITKRLALVLIFAIAYFYYAFIVQQESLVSIGMISFIGIAQLAPGFLGALFWRRGTSLGVLLGLLVGFGLWLTAFGVPQWLGERSGELALFGVFENWSPMANITFISLAMNSLVMVGVSLMSTQHPLEKSQAEIFYNIMSIPSQHYDRSPVTSGKITFERLEKMLLRFLPDNMMHETLYKRYTIDRIKPEPFKEAPAQVVSYAERLLTQMMGPATARIVLNREMEGDTINTFDIQDILEETRETKKLNRELQEKSDALARLTKELTTANDQLKTISTIKDDFLYSVTHELRSPLTAIRAQIEIIREEGDAMPAEVRANFLDATIEESVRLTHLISNVLDIEKFESGNQQLSLKRLNLKEMIDRVLETHWALALNEGVQISYSGPEHATVNGDSDRMQQVLVNLVSNAIKHADHQIKIALQECSNKGKALWCLELSDDGAGVPESDVPHLFEKFYQSRDQTVKKRLGTGLGLAISHNIIKAHGGQLKLAKNPPEGPTTFSFTLPKINTNE